VELDALPIIPISDDSIVRHESDEVFWFVYEPHPWVDRTHEDEPYYDDSLDWVCFGSWIKETT